MPPALVVMNAGAYVRPGRFKQMLRDAQIGFTNVGFGVSAHKFVEVIFDSYDEALRAQAWLLQQKNFRGEAFKVRVYEDYTEREVVSSRPRQHAEDASDSSSEDSAARPQNVFFGAPFYDPERTGDDELLFKQKMVRNQVKHYFMRILKGQTLASAAAANTPALQNLKMQPAYLRDETLKQRVMTLPPIADCELKYYYRTKSEFAMQNGNVGAFCRNNDYLQCFSADETAKCRLHPEIVISIAREIQRRVSAQTSGSVVFRCAGAANGCEFRVTQVLLSVESQNISAEEAEQVLSLQNGFPELVGVSVNGCARGQAFLCYELLGTTFKVTKDAFFQSNLLAAENLFRHVASLIPASSQCVLDGCCGCGVIGLAVWTLFAQSQRQIRVIGIDVCADSIRAAQDAAQEKNANAEYVCATLESRLDLINQCDSAVFDPPRAGLHPSVPKAVRASYLQHLIYVSCCPKSLGRDLFALCAETGGKKPRTAPFYVASLQAFNSFPGCEHVETVAELRRWTQ